MKTAPEIIKVKVSIIITTKNEARHVAACLRSVKSQSYSPDRLEIIVVDNNSTDETKAIASRFTSHVFNHGPERAAQRNFGIAQAVGRYILYLDADMILSKDLISDCVQKCERDNLVALYIPERIIGKGFWIKVRDFERGFYNQTAIDCVRFVKKRNFEDIDGFDEDLNGPEDWDFDRRVRVVGPTGISGSCLYHDEGRFNLLRYVAKKRYYARGFARYINKWGKKDPIIRKQFGISYRYFGVFIEEGRWKNLLAHPVLTMGMCLLRLAVGLVFIYSRLFKD